jgi:hypothetical protein
MTTKRTLYTLCVDDYAPEITELTFPLMRTWAEKIGADFCVMTARCFPEWPAQCEKFQLPTHAAAQGDEWSIFLDADVLIHPDFPDIFQHLDRSTVYHNGLDVATTRFNCRDAYFQRDGRFRSPGNWLCVVSDWTREDAYSFPPPDLTPEQTAARIRPHVNELAAGVHAVGLIDDFLMARNAARFGLHTGTIENVMKQLGLNNVLWHNYLPTNAEKVPMMKSELVKWGLR